MRNLMALCGQNLPLTGVAGTLRVKKERTSTPDDKTPIFHGAIKMRNLVWNLMTMTL
jgi:hypothetical protein